jgi:glycosyltransferase involved in cell wall biosynthesis
MADFDLLCLSHLRWNFVFQRPQQLLTRAATEHRVFYFEEPIYGEGEPRLEQRREGNVQVVVPHLPAGTAPDVAESMQRTLLDELCREQNIARFVLWFYTPMALAFTHHLRPLAVIFDCMDELSAFHGAPPALLAREAALLHVADLVFTGGQSLFEAKRHRHRDIHAFPSSVDVPHFAAARSAAGEPADQAPLPHPRIGYFGVIDERMDLDLLAGVADARPDFQLVMVGPVVKIDEARLPRRPNIHWLGGRRYAELPDYIAGWDVAMMPFARNESTRFISPTKTPEYLAAGRPVVSTSIRDVVRPYGELGLARIADTVPTFVAAIDDALAADRTTMLAAADDFLASLSWDRTWRDMQGHIERVVRRAGRPARAAHVAAEPSAQIGAE